MATPLNTLWRRHTERNDIEAHLRTVSSINKKMSKIMVKLRRDVKRQSVLPPRDQWLHNIYQISGYIAHLRKKLEDVQDWAESAHDDQFEPKETTSDDGHPSSESD